jgi:hypothetical protein
MRPEEKTLADAAASLEMSLIALRCCYDSRGLKVILGGTFEQTKRDFEKVNKWVTDSKFTFIDGEMGRVAALHNLAKLAHAYACYLDYQRLGGRLEGPL